MDGFFGLVTVVMVLHPMPLAQALCLNHRSQQQQETPAAPNWMVSWSQGGWGRGEVERSPFAQAAPSHRHGMLLEVPAVNILLSPDETVTVWGNSTPDTRLVLYFCHLPAVPGHSLRFDAMLALTVLLLLSVARRA